MLNLTKMGQDCIEHREAPKEITIHNTVYRKINHAPGYYISKTGLVFNTKRKKFLIVKNKRVILYIFGYREYNNVRDLINYVWGARGNWSSRYFRDGVEWRRIPEHEGYIINREGVVINMRSRKVVKIYDKSETSRGYVWLITNKLRHYRSILSLLGEVFYLDARDLV